MGGAARHPGVPSPMAPSSARVVPVGATAPTRANPSCGANTGGCPRRAGHPAVALNPTSPLAPDPPRTGQSARPADTRDPRLPERPSSASTGPAGLSPARQRAPGPNLRGPVVDPWTSCGAAVQNRLRAVHGAAVPSTRRQHHPVGDSAANGARPWETTPHASPALWTAGPRPQRHRDRQQAPAVIHRRLWRPTRCATRAEACCPRCPQALLLRP